MLAELLSEGIPVLIEHGHLYILADSHRLFAKAVFESILKNRFADGDAE